MARGCTIWRRQACDGLGNISLHLCWYYFGTYHLPKHCCRPRKHLHGCDLFFSTIMHHASLQKIVLTGRLKNYFPFGQNVNIWDTLIIIWQRNGSCSFLYWIEEQRSEELWRIKPCHNSSSTKQSISPAQKINLRWLQGSATAAMTHLTLSHSEFLTLKMAKHAF